MGFVDPGRSSRRRYQREAAEQAPRKRRPVKRIAALDQLPIDVLFHIFTLIDIRQNHIHLTNKYFNRLFTPANLGEHYTGILIRNHFVHNLNRLVDPVAANVRKLVRAVAAKRIDDNFTSAFDADFAKLLERRCALDIALFSFGFVTAQSVSKYSNYAISSTSDIDSEARKRLDYVKTQVRHLHRALQEHRASNNEASEDDLSRIAEEMSIGTGAELREYDFSAPIPTFPAKYHCIGSLERLNHVKFLNRQFGFVYSDINPVVHDIVGNGLPDQLKSLAIEAVLAIGGGRLSPITVKSFLQLAIAADSKELLQTVNSVLEAFYSSATDDRILWDFVIHHENLTLLEIMNQFSSPAI